MEKKIKEVFKGKALLNEAEKQIPIHSGELRQLYTWVPG